MCCSLPSHGKTPEDAFVITLLLHMRKLKRRGIICPNPWRKLESQGFHSSVCLQSHFLQCRRCCFYEPPYLEDYKVVRFMCHGHPEYHDAAYRRLRSRSQHTKERSSQAAWAHSGASLICFCPCARLASFPAIVVYVAIRNYTMLLCNRVTDSPRSQHQFFRVLCVGI